jgi:hypothetical protein
VGKGLGKAFGLKNCFILFPRDESATNCSTRRWRVSSFFALTIHQIAARLYDAGWAAKNSSARAFLARTES